MESLHHNDYIIISSMLFTQEELSFKAENIPSQIHQSFTIQLTLTLIPLLGATIVWRDVRPDRTIVSRCPTTNGQHCHVLQSRTIHVVLSSTGG